MAWEEIGDASNEASSLPKAESLEVSSKSLQRHGNTNSPCKCRLAKSSSFDGAPHFVQSFSEARSERFTVVSADRHDAVG
jgi:hypothetical protein